MTIRWIKDSEYEEVIPCLKVWLRGKGTFEDPQKQVVGVEFTDHLNSFLKKVLSM